MGERIAEDDDMDESAWIKIGEHSSQDTLKQTAKKLRSKWLGRYDFQICKCQAKKGFELHLRHR